MYATYARLRDEKGLNDNAVATATGITQSTIYDWKQRSQKNPKAGMSVENLKKIARFFNVPVDRLLEEEE